MPGAGDESRETKPSGLSSNWHVRKVYTVSEWAAKHVGERTVAPSNADREKLEARFVGNGAA